MTDEEDDAAPSSSSSSASSSRNSIAREKSQQQQSQQHDEREREKDEKHDEGELEAALEDEAREAEIIIHLPPMRLSNEQSPMLKEYERQVQMQLEGLNTLTAKEWLINTLLNRMKTTDSQTTSSYGTDTGRKLAGKIDGLLWKNHKLAVLVMQGIQQRMEAVRKAFGKKTPKEVDEISNAAADAQKAKDVYTTFRRLKGLSNLELLSRANLMGGLGRQQGEGDNTWFREKFSDGIKLLANDSTFKSNACLHNPDQCAGGPMELLWQSDMSTELTQIQTSFQRTREAYRRQSRLVESYRKSAPKTLKGDIDKKKMEDAEEELEILQTQYMQAEEAYRKTMMKHVGNRQVNSDLGKNWMQKVKKSNDSRVGIMLDTVLKQPLDSLATSQMNVSMKVNPSSPSVANSNSSSSSNKTSASVDPIPTTTTTTTTTTSAKADDDTDLLRPARSKRKRHSSSKKKQKTDPSKKIKRAKKKMKTEKEKKGGLQLSLMDMRFPQPSSSSSSTTATVSDTDSDESTEES